MYTEEQNIILQGLCATLQKVTTAKHWTTCNAKSETVAVKNGQQSARQ